jgi:DNA modification methylase
MPKTGQAAGCDLRGRLADVSAPELTVVDALVGSLRPHESNPRSITKQRLEALKADLDADPEMLRARPLIVLPDGRVIAGNQRLRAIQELGWESVPVVYADLDEGRAREWALRDNNAYGQWDEQALAEYLQEMVDAGAELARTGFTDRELEQYLRHASGYELVDPELPPLPEEPESELGEVYELGEHRLLCGDATDPEQIAALLQDESADLLWTDPPYGVSYADKNEFLNAIDKGNRVQKPIEHDHGSPEEMAVFWRTAFTAVRPVMRPGACYYVTGPQGGDLLLHLLSALRDSGFPLRHMLVWAKNQHVLGRSDYHYQHEPVIYGWVEGTHQFYGVAGETSLWQVDRPRESKLHPTMKPVELVARAVRNSSQRGEVVLDPFAGAGSTLIAAEQLGRRAFLVEIDPAYCDVIRQRYDDWMQADRGGPTPDTGDEQQWLPLAGVGGDDSSRLPADAAAVLEQLVRRVRGQTGDPGMPLWRVLELTAADSLAGGDG